MTTPSHTPTRLAAALAVSLLGSAAFLPAARAQTALSEAPATVLDDVVVTATRSARTAQAALAPVTVFTRADIAARQPASVVDLLRTVPGISLSRNGGAGKASALLLRGTEADHVLVLIDGVKVGSPTLGSFAFEDLPVALIERIEVVRGPRSSLYGSEAVGGVIQIFTRRGGGTTQWDARLALGSHATRETTLGVRGGGDTAWFSASLTHLSTDGENSCDVAAAGRGGCFTAEPDRDGYRRLAGSVQAGLRLDGGTTLGLQWQAGEADNDFDGSFQNQSETRQQTLSLHAETPVSERIMTSARLSRSTLYNDNFLNGRFASRFDSVRDLASVQADIELAPAHLVTTGLDVQRDTIDSDVDYAETRRDNTGLFALYQGALGTHAVQAALRHDDNEQFGHHTTGSLAWSMPLTTAVSLRASVGTAFKAPTFNELYYPFFGSPDLDPERSRSVELALSGPVGGGNWALTAYRTRIDDLISYDAAIGLANNISRARISGLEAEWQGTLAGWDSRVALTVQNPENRNAGAQHGNLLPRRARQMLALDTRRDVGTLSVGATLSAQTHSYDDQANRTRLGGFGLLDLYAGWQVAPQWRLEARLDNVFDKDYETARYYRSPGRSLMLALAYSG